MALAQDLHIDDSFVGWFALDTVGSIDAAFDMVLNAVRDLPTADGVACAGRYQDQLAALEADLLARNLRNGGTDRQNEKLTGASRPTSKREAKKRARRGAAVNQNPDLGTDLADGALGTEQLDVIAEASAKTGGDAANDTELIDEIKNEPPDKATSITKKWLENHNAPDGDGANKRYERQRRLRDVTRFDTEDGLAALLLKGDDETIDEWWTAINAGSKQLYRNDGGRDVPEHKHPRTRRQRLFDAATQLFGSRTSPSSDGSKSRPRSSPKATIFIWQTLDDYIAGNSRATFADGRTVPTAVFDRYRCSAELAAILFDGQGELLYQGRAKRYATPAQIRGLIARDQGCVRCGANASTCEAHHLLPWNAPVTGNSDISNLALVCTDCHHFIHDTHQTLYRSTDGTWQLRPATPGEIAPQHNQVKRE